MTANELSTLLSEMQRLTFEGRIAEAAPRCERGADRAERGGERDGAVLLYLGASRLWMMLGDEAGTTRTAEAAVRLCGGLGSPDDLYVVLAEAADRFGDVEHQTQAWSEVRRQASPKGQVQATAKLAELARRAAQWVEMDALLGEAVTLSEAQGDVDSVADFLIERAVARTAMGDHGTAERLIELALEAAPSSSIRDARALGQRGVIALACGRVEEAIVHALGAREAAVLATDVPTYLATSTLLLTAYEAAGQLVLAYDTLLRARGSLGELLGEPGRALVAPALSLFEERLGEERLEEVHEAWSRGRREARAGHHS
ncbi:MAG: hypothetical protein EXR76_14995 [Myxococcales bacterium]|nr:hypothetical protein [Myxococcales bacterium]